MEVSEKLMNEFKTQSEEITKNKTSLKEDLQKEINADKEEKTILEARLDVYERKAKDALVEENSDEAEKYRQKAEEARSTLERRKLKILSLSEELNKIDDELSKVAKKVLQCVYPQIQEEVFATWDYAIETADEAWAGLQAYGVKTGISISSLYKDSLMIRDHAPHKELYRRLHTWV
jgi:hypothetical protein